MGNLNPIDGQRTDWQGLWYHPENGCFTSCTFSLADLRKFKGRVKIIVKKNKYYNKGMNGRPNYVFMICDSQNKKYLPLTLIEEEDEDNDGDSEIGSLVPG